MAAPDPNDLELYNFFNSLRNEGAAPITLQALTAIWRTRNYIPPAQPVIAARPPISRAFTGVRSADYATAPRPLAPDEQAWLANDVGLPNGIPAWVSFEYRIILGLPFFIFVCVQKLANVSIYRLE